MEKQAVVRQGLTPELDDDLRPEYDLRTLQHAPLEKRAQQLARAQKRADELAQQDPNTRLAQDASK